MTKKEVDFLKQLVPQISERVSKKRKSLKCIEMNDETSWDIKYVILEHPIKGNVFSLNHFIADNWKNSSVMNLRKNDLEEIKKNIKKKAKTLPQSAVTNDRSKLSEIERGISRKKNGTVSNFMPYYIGCNISEKLQISKLELYYGDMETFYSNVKWIFLEIAFNIDITLYDFNTTSNSKVKYPNLISVSESLFDLFMFDGKLSAMYETARFEDTSGQLAPFQTGYVKDKERAICERKIETATSTSDKKIWKAKLKSLNAHDDYLKKNMSLYEQINEDFEKRYAEIVERVWQEEKDYFIQSFIHNVVQKDSSIKSDSYLELKTFDEEELNLNLLKINKVVTKWIVGEFYRLIKGLKEDYSEDDIKGIGYQISAVLSRRTQLWIDRIWEESKTKRQIVNIYDGFAQEMVKLQQAYWDLDDNEEVSSKFDGEIHDLRHLTDI